MSKFTFSCRWVLNPRVPIGGRFNAFIRCCSAFGKLAQLAMQDVYDQLGRELGFSREKKPTVEQMVEAIAVLLTARSRLHYARQMFESKCRRAIRAGRRWKGQVYEGIDPIQLLRGPRGKQKLASDQTPPIDASASADPA